MKTTFDLTRENAWNVCISLPENADITLSGTFVIASPAGFIVTLENRPAKTAILAFSIPGLEAPYRYHTPNGYVPVWPIDGTSKI